MDFFFRHYNRLKYPQKHVLICEDDLPQGNGTDLLNWFKKNNKNIPIITFSGIQQNNINMMNLGATHLFNKEEVISGKADILIKNILGES